MGSDRFDERQRWVLVTGIRRQFVEFEFTVGDPDLTVELIMPRDAFEEFCRDNHATLLPMDEDIAKAYEQLRWRSGHAGTRRSSQKQ